MEGKSNMIDCWNYKLVKVFQEKNTDIYQNIFKIYSKLKHFKSPSVSKWLNK